MPTVETSGPSRTRLGYAVERALLVSGIVVLFLAGYFGVGWATDPARARELATPLDAWIPFVPQTVWIYLWVFPAAFVPVFVVRSRTLFRRSVLAYAVTIVLSLLCFVSFPVTSTGLRVDPTTLDTTDFSQWAVSLVYALDPPYNLFPSLHLSIATLAGFAAWKADRRYGAATFLGVALVGASICTVKQHFVLDGVAGVALAVAVYAATFRSYQAAPGEDVAYSWRGPAAYLVVLVLVYTGFYVAFLLSS